MVFESIDKKLLIIFGLVGLYIFYAVFLKEKKKSNVDEEYDKVLNSEECKVKGQWE